jgi:hypothetical protein
MARWENFRPCPGCGYDVATGEGERSCHHYDCPYLPEELDVFCPTCRFDLATMEGNAPCDDPLRCEDAEQAREHVMNLRTWQATSTRR